MKISRISLISLIAVAAVAATALLLAPTPASALALRNTSNNLGLVGYWNLNDGTSTKATDFSGRGNTGTLTNMEAADWVAGKKGKALTFDGVNEYVSLGNPANLQLTTGTVSAWIKTSNAGASYRGILVKQNAYSVFLKDNVLMFYDWGSAVERNTSVNLADNSWHHVVVTFQSGVSGGTIIYSDGTARLTTTMMINNQLTEVQIGYGNASPQYFNGSIDDVRIYNRALSATEIANMYNDGQATIKAKDNTGLVAYYSMEDGAGSKATDFSGKGNTGTITHVSGGSELNASFVNGKRGRALNFPENSNNYVAVPTISIPTGAITVAAWIYSTHFADQGAMIVEKEPVNNQWELMLEYGVVRWRGGSTDSIYTTTPSNNQWHHVVGTQAGTTAFLYIDGVQAATGSITAIANGAGVVNIGRYDSGYYFRGSIDDVRIYNRALTAQQVLDLYNAGATTASPTIKTVSRNGLVGYWSLDDGTSTKATDFSGNGNTGTLLPSTSTPAWVTGKRGKGLQLSTTDYDQKRYVEATNTTNTSLNASGTVALWFKGTNIETANEALFSKGNDVSGLNGVLFSVRTNQGLAWYFGSASATQSKQGIGTIVNGTWYHAVFTWDGSNIKTYLNGSIADSTAQTVIPVTTVDPIRIGNNAIINRNFVGTVDEVRVYNRALTATEVQTLYNIGR